MSIWVLSSGTTRSASSRTSGVFHVSEVQRDLMEPQPEVLDLVCPHAVDSRDLLGYHGDHEHLLVE